MTDNLDWLLRLCLLHHQRTAEDPEEPMPIDRLPAFFSDLRNTWQNFLEGNWLALLDALAICHEHELPVPDWLQNGLREFVVSSVRGETLGRRGKGNSPLAQVRDEWKRRKRAQVFQQIRLAQSLPASANDGLVFALFLPEETLRLFREGKVRSVGTTREDAIRLTFESLRGTPAQASISTLDRMMTEYTSTVGEFDVSKELLIDLGLETDGPPDLEFLGFHFMSIDELATQQPNRDAEGDA